MNQGDSRKDIPAFFSRRRQQSFDLEECARNGNPFTSSVMSLPYSNSVPASHRQPFNYWSAPSYYQPHGHPAGARHRYSGHQMFMQHGPFGGENNQYRPVGYLPQFRMRFAQSLEHQHAMFNGEPRRNGFDYQCDRRHFEDAGKARLEYSGLINRDRGFKSDQSARPKSGKFPGGKTKVYKKKSNHNSSSGVSFHDREVDKTDNKFKNKRKQEKEVLPDEVVSVTNNSCDVTSLRESNNSQDVDCERKGEAQSHGSLIISREVSEFYSNTSKDGGSVDSHLCNEEGAVGGDAGDCCDAKNITLALKGDNKFDKSSYDTNLIDEGAICDLDKMFQHQEFSCYSGDISDDCQSDSEMKRFSGCENGRTANDNLSKENSSDDESESENCSYVYKPQQIKFHDVLGSDLLQCTVEEVSCSHGLNKHLFSGEKKVDVGFEGRPNDDVSNCNGDISDEAEDTGDFIDTDLPSHNKHILSSSDEMDNISSSSGSDHESRKDFDDCKNRRQAKSEFNCNDLSTGSKVQNELQAMSIREKTDLATSLSSQVHTEGCTENRAHSSSIRRAASCSSSSSESENGDRSLPGSHSSFSTTQISIFVCYNPMNPCLDGAAASQVSSEIPQKPLDDIYNTCPPGADCELPQSSPSQCFFYSDIFCHGERPGSCSNTDSNHSPGREHNAFTASSALDPVDAFALMRKQEFAGCSVTSDGGACCPPGYQLSQVNDLNACCHHSHIHLANGFTHDTQESNFSNDEINRHQKVFVKFPVEDKMDEKGSHPASSCDLEDINRFAPAGRKQDKNNDSGGTEDPLSHDIGDNVDMVLLPMEEEIEPVHHMSSGLCAGAVEDNDELYQDLQLATGSLRGTNISHLCDEHQYSCMHDQNPLRNGMPSKEFYDLIKTVSTTDSYMRFYDKDGQDVQRQPFTPCDDDETSKQSTVAGGQSSKTERLKVDRVMIWNEYEAYVMQFKQIAVSACGQTAVLNVLKALKFSFEKSAVCKIIQTSLRKEDACVPEYLFSRAKAGTTAEELMLGVEKLSGGAVGGRFFHFWPPRKVKLLQWLAYWMKRGAIPIATLNLQQGPHSLWQVPDSWHHQMVYGVSHQGLYLTNPLEIVSERSAMKQLCSDSVLMVRRGDIISRFREITDLSQLLNHPDPRWRTMNVLGQVVNVLREYNMPSVPGYRLQVTSHVSIPASYKAGITLFMPKDKSAWNTLINAPEIPLKD